MLRICDLSKVYGRTVVLRGLNLELKDGIYCFFGPNGSGKTTLLRIISGFEKPSCGRVFFEGKEITGLSPQRIVKMGIAIAFQLPRVFWNLDVEQNIFLACMDKKKVKEVVKTFRLEEDVKTIAKKLSQGKIKLLQISMSYATNPRLLLLDEPFAGLDVGNVRLLIEILKELVGKKSMIITSHRPKLLRGIANKFFEIRGGKIAGSYENPT
ncbi:MAG: ATP-binding cassette domain-containing protein [Archaeoglobaceae archaeon]|nr:ATP-binding cassette domain-containing protein [Archaeoglobaceae archaeon]MDW7989871.1 ATP-binding cassette domain-containing protein [Archaeoglobaceae archaeon]